MPELDFDIPLTPPRHEVVVDRKTNQPRQAGASQAEGAWIKDFRYKAEASLYAFTKGVLGKDYLTRSLHLPVCDFLQVVPPQRKAALLPREHGKTTIVGHSLPLHILIQPRDHNCYFPGEDGCEQRIIMIGEKEQRATDSLRVVETALETNEVLRALWPNLKRAWEWSRATDVNGDGLMENPAAGAGALEVGDLQIGILSDVYLGGVWVAALDRFARMAQAMGEPALSDSALAIRKRALATMEAKLWMAS